MSSYYMEDIKPALGVLRQIRELEDLRQAYSDIVRDGGHLPKLEEEINRLKKEVVQITKYAEA